MSTILWEKCRDANGVISLERAAKMSGCWFSNHALNYLVAIEKIMPISSRQAAAVAIATAIEISSHSSTK